MTQDIRTSDTSPSVATAPEQSAPETTDNGEVARLKAEAAVAKSEARYQALARKVDQDEFQFRSVFQADQKAAERIAREKWKLTPSEVLGQLAAAEQAAKPEPETTTVVPEHQIRAFLASERERESAAAAKESAVAALGLQGEALEAFEREYATITNGRNVTASEAKRFVKAAFALVHDSDVVTVEAGRAAVAATVRVGQSSEGTPTPDPETQLQSEVRQMRERNRSAGYSGWYATKK